MPAIEIPRHPLWVLAYEGAWETWFRQADSLTAVESEAFAAATYVKFAGDHGTIGSILTAARDAPEPSPLLAWLEWALYLHGADRARLSGAFEALAPLYARRSRSHRRPDGLYWQNTLDPTSPREPHGWVDTTAQTALAAESLAALADALGRPDEAARFATEHRKLCGLLNRLCWGEEAGCYLDRRADGSHAPVRSAAGFWALTAGAPDAPRAARVAATLADPGAFWRVHVFPCLSADHPRYAERGAGLRGSVLPLANYAAVRGLERCGHGALALRAADNHVTTVSHVYKETRAHWDNYMPDYIEPGSIARPDYAPTAGIASVALLIETLLGLRVDAPARALHWAPRLREAHAVRQLRVGDAEVTLQAAPADDDPQALDAVLRATAPLTLLLTLPGETRRLPLRGELHLRV